MAEYTISVSARIAAPAPHLYAILADYTNGHPRILPRPPFGDLAVEQGGVGEGTVIRFEIRTLGQLQTIRAAVSEPEPGRLLTETNLQTGERTSFLIEPQAEPNQTLVTITSTMQAKMGVLHTFEAWLAARLLRPLYTRELAQLAAVAAQHAQREGGTA